jgi:hypothetical protein
MFRELNRFTILVSALLFFTHHLKGQQLFIQSAGNFGNQLAVKSGDPSESNEFYPGSGYSFGISLNDIKYKLKRNFSFYLGFESFGGGFRSSYSGLGGGSSKSGNFQKYIIDFEFHPWKFKLLSNLFLSPGFEINGTIGKDAVGTYSQYQMGTAIPDVDLNEFKGLVGPLNMGTNMNFSYELKFNRITVAPSYKFSFFLLPELNLNTYTFSHRHSFVIALGYALN